MLTIVPKKCLPDFYDTNNLIIFKFFKKNIENSFSWKGTLKSKNKLRFLKFLKKVETDQKYEETGLKIWGNRPKKIGNHSTINIGKPIRHISKPLNNSLRDFLEFLKKRKLNKSNFRSVSVLRNFHVTTYIIR